jgi:hypothetical protein
MAMLTKLRWAALASPSGILQVKVVDSAIPKWSIL